MAVMVTNRSTHPNSTVLTRLAERWRPAGLYLACMDREGNLLWHDSHMPRLMAIAVTADASIAQQIKALSEGNATKSRLQSPFNGVQVYAAPFGRRKKSATWVVMLARVDAITPNENLDRAAGKSSLDVQGLIVQTQRVPVIHTDLLPSLVEVAEHMYEDMQSTALMQNEISSVTEQLTTTYEEISLLHKISSGMRFSQKPTAFLEQVCREVQEIGGYRAVAVALAQPRENSQQVDLNGIATLVGNCPVNNDMLVHALHEPLLDALHAGDAMVYNEIAPDDVWANLRTSMQRFACVPLVRDRRPLGVMLAIDKTDHSEFNSVDMKLLTNVGNQCAIFLENAALYQDMQGLFMGVLHALTRSIDAKDAYTRGHSQRVAELSRALAQRIGLPDEQCERIYLSGLLHDVGKIGVPEAVLTKPGRLTDAEFDTIKKHPIIGAQILGNIKQLQDILPGVLYHHERWDGRGYPYQLSGEAIPLIGRIICVADSFDAMSSTRTYRPALPLDTVLAEIKRCAGAQFDPALAAAFVALDFSQYKKSMDEALASIKPVSITATDSSGGQ